MADVVALEYPVSSALRDAIERCLHRGEPFAVLDPRDEPSRRAKVLASIQPRFIENAAGERYELGDGVPVRDGDAALIVTSGSSGPPKVAIHTLEGLRASARLTSAALRRTDDDCWFASLPAHHVGGLATILRGVFSHSDTIFGSANDPDAARRAGATHVSVVRTLLARHDYDAFACVLLGGGPAPDRRPKNVVTTWGMTETGSGVVYDGVPLPSVELAMGEDDELFVRSPTLLRAYRHDDDPLTLGPDGTPGWLATGDAASIVDGRLRVKGRLRYVINTGGEKVWPEDLETVLREIPGVHDVAVCGRDDAEWGQRVVAFLVSDRAENELAADCRAVARAALGAHAAPKEIVLVRAIPRAGGGKVDRAALA